MQVEPEPVAPVQVATPVATPKPKRVNAAPPPPPVQEVLTEKDENELELA